MLPLLSTALLLADDALPLPSREEPPTEVHYKPITTIDFGALDLTTTADRPMCVWSAPRRLVLPTVIALRSDFTPEMNASVDEIR